MDETEIERRLGGDETGLPKEKQFSFERAALLSSRAFSRKIRAAIERCPFTRIKKPQREIYQGREAYQAIERYMEKKKKKASPTNASNPATSAPADTNRPIPSIPTVFAHVPFCVCLRPVRGRTALESPRDVRGIRPCTVFSRFSFDGESYGAKINAASKNRKKKKEQVASLRDGGRLKEKGKNRRSLSR